MKYLVRKTRQLVIRCLVLRDYECWKQAHLKMKNPQNTWDVGSWPARSLTKVEFKKIIRSQTEQRKKDKFYDLGIFDKSGALVGGVSLMEVSRGISQTAYLGYSIFNNHWGQGYGKEAVQAMIEIAFEEIKLHRIEAGIEPTNKRSLKLARSLGMRREGLKKRALFLRNKWVDLVIYTLTSEDVGKRYPTKNLKWKRRS